MSAEAKPSVQAFGRKVRSIWSEELWRQIELTQCRRLQLPLLTARMEKES